VTWIASKIVRKLPPLTLTVIGKLTALTRVHVNLAGQAT
jgi:hypothetical protein